MKCINQISVLSNMKYSFNLCTLECVAVFTKVIINWYNSYNNFVVSCFQLQQPIAAMHTYKFSLVLQMLSV